MITRKLAATGLGLVALMHAILLSTALPHPVWSAVNGLGLAGALAAGAGFALLHRRAGLATLAVGIALMLAARVVVVTTPGAGVLVPSFMIGGFLLALLGAALWAVRPSREPAGRATLVRFGLAIVAVASFASMVMAVSTRPLAAILALAIGTAGWALAAPNVEAEPAHAAWAPRPKKPKKAKQPAAEAGDAATTGL